MKKIIPLIFFLFTGMLSAQVGINTAVPDAQLDIRSSNQTAPNNKDGLLVPKMDTFPATNPTAAQNGMLVFLTTAVGANPPGFYYWDYATTSWKGVGTDNTKWGLGGNAGTNPSTHFIGTTDNQDLVFKRNNSRVGFLGSNNTAFGTNSMSNISGTGNAVFGRSAMGGIASGSNNIAIGDFTISGNGGGSNNTAVGFEALSFIAAGNENVGVGRSALRLNINGIGNTALGTRALAAATSTSSNNVAIGKNAGSMLVFGHDNIVIGTDANLPSSNSNAKLNIGNTIFGDVGVAKNIGINTAAPKGMLDVESATNGIVIPRIALTASNVDAPVVNPQGGAIAESTLIYNTATEGVSPNEVTPGFYFWNASKLKWVRFDVGGEQMPKYYFAKGTTVAPPTTEMSPMPEMQITFTPKGNTAIVHFSAGGYATTGCTERTILFQILLNNVIASQWQSSTEAGSATLPIWDTSNSITVAVTPNVAQTISVSWFVHNCNSGANQIGIGFGTPKLQAHRELMVIDPDGGAANIPSVTPVTTANWNMQGNTGINASQHFVGTLNNADLILKRNNLLAGRLGVNNTSFGTSAMIAGTGQANTAIGNMAIQNLSSGTNNTALGSEALADNTSGSDNTAVGRLALAGNTAGTLNTAIGLNALLAGGGSKNTALGANATTSGVRTNATALGANAFVAVDNGLVLGAVTGENNATTNTNVGIGTTSPLRALHVSRGPSGATATTDAQMLIEDDANVFQQFLTPAANESGLLFGTAAGSIRSAIVFNNVTNLDGLQLRTGGNTTRLAINAIGDVGVGTTAPEADLEVSGTGEEVIRVSSTSATGSIASLDLFRNGAGSFDWRLRNNGGELYFMRSDDDFATAPDEHYRMTTTYFRPIDATKSLGQLTFRWTSVFATNGVIQTSDANDKQSIEPITSGIGKIMDLKPVSFAWKDKSIDNHSTHLGFIAQEVQKVLPEIVVDSDWHEQKEGEAPVWKKSDRLGMKYVEIIPVMVKAMQEQQQTIESQNKRLSALEEANRKLQQQLETHDRQLQEILNRLSSDK